ncbi:T9SS type A sorting domain-containing protein, partial [candidate division KSB1 bacterium]|nr:T9SS type A sorting domain-containing protein [candidate division KSB1 bacterium]
GAETEGWESAFAPVPRWWQRIFYQYHYPDQDDISRKQKEYIQNFIYNYESLMKEPDYADLQNGYSRYINVNSFVDNFILIEMTKNIDGYRLSTFFHKDRDSKDGRLTMGPVWDYNLAFGNADYYKADVIHGWQVDFKEKDDFWQIPFWWQKLMADPNFVAKIYTRWHQLRQDILDTSRIISIIDSMAVHIDEAQKRNFKRWDILGTYIWPNPYIGGSYYAEIRYLKYWLQSRILWMDMNLQNMLAVDRENSFPAHFALKQNHPNPFNSKTQIDYILWKSGNVRIVIYDLLGKHIKTLVNNPQQAGNFQVRWDGVDENGYPVAAGVYFCRMEAGEFVKTIKLVVTK